MVASMMQVAFWSPVVFLCVLINLSGCDDDFEGLSSLVVEHSLDIGPHPVYTRRGTISIRSVINNLAYFNADAELSRDEMDRLKQLAETDGVYRIRIGSRSSSHTDSPISYVYSFAKACAIYESQLSDILTIHLDQSENLLGISITTERPYCQGIKVSKNKLVDFNTTVAVTQTVAGPNPETQNYVQKLDQEKQAKKAGEAVDNRSFFAKYWMYIVPVVLIMMFANAADSGTGGGGGGR